jgi:hypothetical protein
VTGWRVKAWPGQRLPHPSVESDTTWEIHPSGAFVIAEERPLKFGVSDESAAAPFDEIYLRLAALNAESDEEVLDFVNRFGMIQIYEPDAEERRLRAGVVVRAPYAALSAYPGFDDLDEYDERPDLLAAARAARAAVIDLTLVEQGVHTPPATIQEFRWAARCMRDLVHAYRCLSEERPATDFAWENAMFALDVELQRRGESRGFWTPDRDMQEFLVDTLELGLADYSPRLVYRPDLWPTRTDDWAEHFGHSAGGIWAICCLEFFNHIAEGAIFKDCANETCGRPFVRQTGRAVYGQRRRTGVRFCSHSCARAQAQRAYERRQRSRAEAKAS